MSQAVVISAGCIMVGALCLAGAVNQVRTGTTWGATGRGRIDRASEPAYFWYLFGARLALGAVAVAGGALAINHR